MNIVEGNDKNVEKMFEKEKLRSMKKKKDIRGRNNKDGNGDYWMGMGNGGGWHENESYDHYNRIWDNKEW